MVREQYNPNYIHHHPEKKSASTIRELVFGMEDGMVSTLGSITGIAAATKDPFTTILAGLVIIAVESISMAVGSYLSSKSVKDVEERKLMEERQELKDHPEGEKKELVALYVKSGWTQKTAKLMAEEASENPKLFLQEMSFRELGIIPSQEENPVKNGIVMLFSYVAGGCIPLTAFFFLPILYAIPVAIGITLIGLFSLGMYTASFSKRSWWKAGIEMVVLASAAAAVGYGVGQFVDRLWLHG